MGGYLHRGVEGPLVNLKIQVLPAAFHSFEIHGDIEYREDPADQAAARYAR